MLQAQKYDFIFRLLGGVAKARFNAYYRKIKSLLIKQYNLVGCYIKQSGKFSF